MRGARVVEKSARNIQFDQEFAIKITLQFSRLIHIDFQTENLYISPMDFEYGRGGGVWNIPKETAKLSGYITSIQELYVVRVAVDASLHLSLYMIVKFL